MSHPHHQPAPGKFADVARPAFIDEHGRVDEDHPEFDEDAAGAWQEEHDPEAECNGPPPGEHCHDDLD